MEIYVLDYMTLEVKDIFKPLKNNDGSEQYEINLDEETNATSEIMLEYKESIKKGNFLVINGLYKQFLFIISGAEKDLKGKTVKVILKDISNMFDNKIIEDPIGDLSIENYIKRNIERNYMNTEDTLNNLSYLQIETKTQTKVTVNTDAEDGLFNLHTYITNCRQYKNIRTDFEFKNDKLYIYIEKKTNKLQKIDTNVAEIIDKEIKDEGDYITKVEAYVRYNKTRYYLYLRNDRTTTENPKDPNRLRGKTEVISSETLTTAKEEALNTIRRNRYKHLIEFKIKKNSKLVDVNNLEIGDEVQVRVGNKNYESYISAITIKDNEFVYFKTGILRNRLTDKLNQQDKKIGNKLDITGGDITGSLTLRGSNVVTEQSIKEVLNDVKFTIPQGYNKPRFVKIGELDTSIGYGTNCIQIKINGTTRYGSNKPGFDVIEVSSRGGINITVLSFNHSNINDNYKYGYVNRSDGKTEIWIEQTTYAYRSTVEVNNIINCKVGLLKMQESRPSGFTYINKEIVKTDRNKQFLCMYNNMGSSIRIDLKNDEKKKVSFRDIFMYQGNTFKVQAEGIRANKYCKVRVNYNLYCEQFSTGDKHYIESKLYIKRRRNRYFNGSKYSRRKCYI